MTMEKLSSEIASYADSADNLGAVMVSTVRLYEWAEEAAALEQAEAARKLHDFLTAAM